MLRALWRRVSRRMRLCVQRQCSAMRPWALPLPWPIWTRTRSGRVPEAPCALSEATRGKLLLGWSFDDGGKKKTGQVGKLPSRSLPLRLRPTSSRLGVCFFPTFLPLHLLTHVARSFPRQAGYCRWTAHTHTHTSPRAHDDTTRRADWRGPQRRPHIGLLGVPRDDDNGGDSDANAALAVRGWRPVRSTRHRRLLAKRRGQGRVQAAEPGSQGRAVR